MEINDVCVLFQPIISSDRPNQIFFWIVVRNQGNLLSSRQRLSSHAHSALSINLKSAKKWNFLEVALCFPQRLNSMVYVNFSNGAAATSPKWGPAD